MKTKEKISLPLKILKYSLKFLLPILLIGLFSITKSNTVLMSAWVYGIMAPIEQFVGRLCSIVPFSVGEVLLFAFLGGCLYWTLQSLMLFARNHIPFLLLKRLSTLFALFLWIWAGLCWLWNAAYYAPTFVQRASLSTTAYSVSELIVVTEYFAQNAARLSTEAARDSDGHFTETTETCFKRSLTVYENLSAEFPFLQLHPTRPKPLFCSPLQSALGFTGVYSPITGEANVNIDAPACLLPATIAHEMSHQRMIALEEEANFVGIAACLTCDDPLFQYSGYLMGLIHLCNALYPVDPEAWNTIADRWFTPQLAQDWNDNNSYWAARSSPIETAASTAYDSYLKSNDQYLGIRSYGACVDLLVTYFGPE